MLSLLLPQVWEEQYKMPLVEADIETYIGLIDQFINYQAAGLDLLPVTYSNIKANHIRVFPKAFSHISIGAFLS